MKTPIDAAVPRGGQSFQEPGPANDNVKSGVQDPPASLLPAYLEQIAMSETVTECSRTLNMALKDDSLSVFDVKQLQVAGQQKILALRAAKV